MLTSILSVTVLLLSNSVANTNHTNDLALYYQEPAQYSTLVVSSNHHDPVQREDWLLDIRYPVDDYTNTTSGFGSRNLECSRCSSFHKGLDFTPGRGTPVYAAMDGVITQVENSGEYGVHVIITHRIHEDLVYTTVYAHLQVSNVTKRLQLDNNINKGDILGYVGNTGLSTGPHLHFEIRKNGVHVDPLRILQKNMAETKM
jgi:murein DD-endopeptidase MepM/ murein hydrolase activator NlpD